MAETRYVYDFDEPTDGGRELLGGKGIGLAEMTQLGVPVPAGFTITTDACRAYMEKGDLPEGLAEEVDQHLARLEERAGKRFGDPEDPLLVSVRSGAAISMPGMYGHDPQRRAQRPGDPGARPHGQRALRAGLLPPPDPDVRRDRGRHRRALLRRARQPGGQPPGAGRDLQAHLPGADRAGPSRRTRRSSSAAPSAPSSTRGIRRRSGTAATTTSPTTLAPPSSSRWCSATRASSPAPASPSRDPSTGEAGLFGEFLADAQGEDVVAGIRTPEPLAAMSADRLSDAFAEFVETVQRLESHYRDMQDIEFTVEDGKLFPQTWSAKRTAAAALRAAVDMVDEGLISCARRPWLGSTRASSTSCSTRGSIRTRPTRSPRRGSTHRQAASGAVAFDADGRAAGKEGEAVILVRWETTPDDIHRMIAAQGILTAHGGMTSHAAVVARGMGKPCVAGCEALSSDLDAKTMSLNGTTLTEGETLTIDGGTGEVIAGEVKLIAPDINEDFETVLAWADDLRRLKVRTNADTPEDAAKAREFGAEGIGLCRTEHMFMADDRLPVVREMIMASSEDERRSALDRLLPHQQSDFEGIFEAMAGLPVTIRLLDPPLHEFLPSPEEATGRAHARPDPCPYRSRTRCSAPAAAASASCSPRSTRCRCGQSSAPRSPSATERATRRSLRSCIRLSASRRSCEGSASSRSRPPRRSGDIESISGR